MIRSRQSLLLLAALLVSPVYSQEQVPANEPEASAPSPAAAPTATISLEDAYQREFAFLEAQKRELQGRLQQIRDNAEREKTTLENEVQRLENQLINTRANTEQSADLLAQSERQVDTNAENSQLLESTFLQAGATLESLGITRLNDADFRSQPDDTRLTEAFSITRDLVERMGQVRREQGQFFLADGNQAQGTLIRVGNIAAYGVSDQAAGALAPAGGGNLRLWNRPAEDTARSLAAGETPPVLRTFLFENANIAIEESASKTILGVIRSGGVIGWVIVWLGVLGLILTVLRAIFLQRASADTSRIVEAVYEPLRKRRIDDAIAACKQIKGSAARVVTATLRNIDRDRDHLEDIISESILHESSRLNRFGAFILVIAAVAPLLGLLGTVTGMIATFEVITEFGTSDPKLLSGGIAIALTTTQLGLMVAIPFLLLGNMLSGWAERIKDDMEKAALRVTNIYEEGRAASL